MYHTISNTYCTSAPILFFLSSCFFEPHPYIRNSPWHWTWEHTVNFKTYHKSYKIPRRPITAADFREYSWDNYWPREFWHCAVHPNRRELHRRIYTADHYRHRKIGIAGKYTKLCRFFPGLKIPNLTTKGRLFFPQERILWKKYGGSNQILTVKSFLQRGQQQVCVPFLLGRRSFALQFGHLR